MPSPTPRRIHLWAVVLLAISLAALACQPGGARARATPAATSEALTPVPVVTLLDAATGTPPAPTDTGAPSETPVLAPAASDTPAAPPTATSAVGEIDDVLLGFVRGSAGGLGGGDDLFRIEVDLRQYPDAICNDGTGAIFYVRRYTNDADSGKWQIHLQGGGSCSSGQECAERWTSTDTNYGSDKMSTSQTRPSIRGTGITSPLPANQFSGWNQVLVYYCSSDTWAGTQRDTVFDATDPSGSPITYRLHFEGAVIVDAVIAMLQRQPGGLPVTYRSAGAVQTMPDLDEASLVLFNGSSGGGAGVENNADHVGELLRQSNSGCAPGGPCGLQYMAVIDAIYGPEFAGLDYADAPMCQGTAALCSYEAFMRAQWLYLGQVWGKRGDHSCESWHRDNAPDTVWQCGDAQVVLHNHTTTPFFVRADLQDSNIMGHYLDAGLISRVAYGQAVHDQLLNLANLDSFALEGSAHGASPLRAPGVFGPECGDHVGLTSNEAFGLVTISVGGQAYRFHDILWNWVTGQQPQQALETFDPAHKGPGCP